MRQLVALATLTKKEVVRIMRIWTQTLIPPIITTTLYFVVFGNLLGTRISSIKGFSYIEFIVPGLIMMTVLINSYQNVAGSFFGAKFQRSLEELLVSPIHTAAIIWGYVFGGMARGISVGILVTIVALFFTQLHFYNVIVVISMILLTSMVFSLMGLINGIFAKKFDDVGIVPTFIITPLTYLGGVFYSVSFLPPIWQKVTLGNPIFYVINAFRYGFLGVSDIPIFYSYVILGIFAIGLFMLASTLINRGAGLRS